MLPIFPSLLFTSREGYCDLVCFEVFYLKGLHLVLVFPGVCFLLLGYMRILILSFVSPIHLDSFRVTYMLIYLFIHGSIAPCRVSLVSAFTFSFPIHPPLALFFHVLSS